MLSETPCAEPHAGCCGDWGLETPGYPIIADMLRDIEPLRIKIRDAYYRDLKALFTQHPEILEGLAVNSPQQT